MKDISYYCTPVNARPSKNAFTVVHVYQGGKTICTVPHAKFTKNDYPNCVFENVTDDVAFKAAMRAHQAEVNALRQEFKADALANAGLTRHPKADRAFELAMEIEDGNLRQVVERLEDLAELID